MVLGQHINSCPPELLLLVMIGWICGHLFCIFVCLFLLGGGGGGSLH